MAWICDGRWNDVSQGATGLRIRANEAGAAVWATVGDSRVTRVGHFIRLTRIDEIPQAINILRGDMAFVGPRPERPVFVEQLMGAIPHYADRAAVRPGLTGWAQVKYPYGASIEEAREKLRRGLTVMIREGSTARNLDALLPLIAAAAVR